MVQECQQWIAEAEAAGFETSCIRGGAGNTFADAEVRKSSSVALHDDAKAQLLFERVQQYLEPERNLCRLRGVSDGLNFLRYQEGDRFLVRCFICSRLLQAKQAQ